MCGLVGYLGARDARALLLEGLAALEYRGYDSAGIALHQDGGITAVKAVGNLAALRERALGDGVTADLEDPLERCGIGHTRWATHGAVTEDNAHPHTDTAGRVWVVLNGIVENYTTLRAELTARGAEFVSQTDAEVIPHLLAELLADGLDLPGAVAAATERLDGHYAFCAMDAENPGVLVATRKECPLVVGHADHGVFVASAAQAFAEHTDRVQLPVDGDIVVVSAEGVEILDAEGLPVARPLGTVEIDRRVVCKGDHDTFMLKEIAEQPSALADTIESCFTNDGRLLLRGSDEETILGGVQRVVFVGCGSSSHAAMVARQAVEEWARIPCQVEVASEWRYSSPVILASDLIVGVTQSGETADTLAAMRLARESGARVLAVTNVPGSQATRDADAVLLCDAGTEVSVAATKTFVAQIAAMLCLALRVSAHAGSPHGPAVEREIAVWLRALPALMLRCVQQIEEPARALAAELAEEDFFLFLGRHVGVPVALEGALKLKEVSYVAADAYPAGEMKHGPIALISEGTPVVVVATGEHVQEKTLSNMEEVRARGARIIAVVSDGNEGIGEHADAVLRIPECPPLLAPVLAIVPLQFLAHDIAAARGLNVDQPRNLAKTVTVE